jgi:hypothetical protein
MIRSAELEEVLEERPALPLLAVPLATTVIVVMALMVVVAGSAGPGFDAGGWA